MTRITEKVHAFLREAVRAGDVVVDATAGNGHDTLVLADLVGPAGQVLSFDIQTAALERTRERLLDAGHTCVRLIETCHAGVAEYVPESAELAAACFNLGYLPGGDKNIVTRPDSTVRAIQSCYQLLREQGILTVVAYVGHAGGNKEAAEAEETLDTLSGRCWLQRDRGLAGSVRPRLLVVRKGSADEPR